MERQGNIMGDKQYNIFSQAWKMFIIFSKDNFQRNESDFIAGISLLTMLVKNNG